MASRVVRRTVDLSAYPDLVVIYLGIRVNAWNGIRTIFGHGPNIESAIAAKPDGLLLHEPIVYSLFPMNAGFRQYWRDFDSLEKWARSEPHRLWWQKFMKDSGGTAVWHEAYFMRGGMEAVYDDLPIDIGFLRFAPIQPAHGPMFSARARAGRSGEATQPAPVQESEFAGGGGGS